MGAGQSKPGEPGAEDPTDPQNPAPGGGGRPPTRPTRTTTTETETSTTETTSTSTETSTTPTSTTESTTTPTTTTPTTLSTPTPIPETVHQTLPTSSPLQTQSKSGGKVNMAAIVLPCLFAPFIIAAIAIFVIRRQRKKANTRLLEDFKRRSMFGTRGNDMFSTAKHEVGAPPVSGAASPVPFKPQPPSAYASSYTAPSAQSAYGPAATSPGYPAYQAPPAWGAAPAWQAGTPTPPPAESSAAWSALGVAAPASAPSPVSPSPVSPYEIDDRRQLRITNARSISEQSISSAGHDAPLIRTTSPTGAKNPELGDETLKAWMQD